MSKRIVKNTYFVKVPVSFNAQSLANNQNITPKKKLRLTDDLNVFVGIIIEKMFRKDLLKADDSDGYITLHSTVLGEIFGSHTNVSEVTKLLIKEGVIEKNNSFIIGVISQGYRLTNKYLTVELKKEKITDRTLVRHHYDRKKEIDKKQQNLQKDLEHLIPWITHTELKLDINQVNNFLEWWRYKILKEIDLLKTPQGVKISKSKKNKLKVQLATKIFAHKNSIQDIIENPFTPIRDETGYRLHTFVTNLKSIYRNFLTFKGEELVSIDMMSSQPYLFRRLIDPDFWKKTKSKKVNIGSLVPTIDISDTKPIRNHTTLMSTNIPQTHTSMGFTKTHYNNIIWENDFYSSLMKIIHMDYFDNPTVLKEFKTRERTKNRTMLMIFNKNQVHGWNSFRIPFKEHFPEETKLMNLLHFPFVVSEEKTVKTILPLILQRFESKLILELITKEIYEIDKNIFLLTVHDNIITTKKNEALVKSIMEKVLTTQIGVKPGLKVEHLNLEEAKRIFQKTIDRDLKKMQKTRKRKNSKYTIGKQKIKVPEEIFTKDEVSRILSQVSKPLIYQNPIIEGIGTLFSTRYTNPDQDFEGFYEQ